MEQEFVFTIDPEGRVNIEVSGAKGKSCDIATQDIAKALGTVSDYKRKGSYFEKDLTKDVIVTNK